eukprot:TRINITY_DN577_c0_g1_i2.p1 TRINITY_DN577_c0_g1~~TRINITY_DN577_c0_g1_i2.p1  ORF type:complete len:331 (+),score=56.41 TRINITY_DN577_c0_g1_i2:84-995(+)
MRPLGRVAALSAIAIAALCGAQGAPPPTRAARPGGPGGENAGTAALLVTHEFGPCTNRRLNHLFVSAGPGIDVGALHRAGKGVPMTDRPRSEAPVIAEGQLPAVWKLENLTDNHVWTLFGGPSKGRKQGFLAWFATSPYEYAWHIEYDVAWTGKWDNFFARYENNTADVIASISPYNATPDWYWWQYCPWCRENGEHAMKVRWPIVRVSRRLAESLILGLVSGKAVGHHESVLGSWCSVHLPGCEVHNLEDDGVLAPDGFRLGHCTPPLCDAYNLDVTHPRAANKLWHPFKQCEEYWIPDTGV